MTNRYEGTQFAANEEDGESGESPCADEVSDVALVLRRGDVAELEAIQSVCGPASIDADSIDRHEDGGADED